MSSTTTTTTTSLNTTSSSSSSSSSKMASRTGTKSITKSSSKNVVVNNNNGTSNTVTNGSNKAAAAASGTTKNPVQQSVVVVVAGNAITAADVTSVPSNSHPTTVNDYSENTCIVCFKEVDIFSIGDCNHAVCYECSTRMRVLCCQNECPICRQDLAKVIFTKIKKNFRQLELDHRNNGLYDKKYRICFEDIKIRSEFYKLLEYRCRSCNVDCFLSFRELEDHLRSQHERFYCDFCTENLKIFSFERKLYTYKELGIHKTIGDADNKSHRGHPLCEFCHIRYFDRDELFRHMRREHFFCHFCDADGVCNQFYPDYMSLRGHYTMEHFLCEEGECADEQFTAVFRSDIDLKAHKAQVHGKGLGKTASKQARTLEFEFTLPPRNRQGGGGGGGGGGSGGGGGGDGSSRNGQNRDRTGGRSNDQQHQHQHHHHHRDDESEMGSNNNNNNNNGNNNNNNNLNGIYQNQSVYQIDTQNTEQFPSLGNASGGGTTTTLTLRPNVSIHTKSYGTSGLARTKENFPALGGQNINDQSLLSNERQSNAANTLFKQSSMAAVSNSNSNSNSSKRNQMANGNSMGITTNKNNNNNNNIKTTSKQQKPGMIIHVSNRPTMATSATTSSSSSSSNSNEFPSLPMSNAAKKKAQLYEDLGMMGSMSMGNSTAISTKHRSLMDHFDYSSCLTTTTTNSNTNNYNKISFVQQSDHIQQSKNIDTIKKNDNVPKINSKDIFPTLGKIGGTGTNHSTNTNNNNNNNLSNSQQTTTTAPQWVTQKKSTHQQQQHPISKLKQNPQQVSAGKTRQNNEMVLKISNNNRNVSNVDDLSLDYRNNHKNNSKNIKNNNNNVIKINNNNKMDNNKLKPKQQKGNHNNNNNKKIELESGYIDNTTDYNAIEEYISVKHRPLTKGGFIHESTRVNSKLKLISQLPTTTTTTGAASAVTSTKSKTKTKSIENNDEGVEGVEQQQQNDYENVPLSNKKPILPISIKSDKNFPKLNSKSKSMKDINNNNNSTSSSNLGHLNSIYSELLKSNLNSEKLPNNNGKNSIDSSTSNSIGSRSRSHSSQSSNGSQDEDQSDYTDFMNGKQTDKNKLGGSKGAIPKNSQSHNSNNFINSVTLNSIAKPINNLTFTTSTGEQFSILPQAHQYMAPEDAMQRNLDLVTKVQNILETPVAVEEFKNISQLFRDDGYHAYPYYEHCEIVLGTEFDRIFPELLSLLPDIGKQQELYLVYSQQLKIYNKEAKSKKKKQRISIMEVCSVCKQVLINKDYPPHMQAHIFLSEFPATLG